MDDEAARDMDNLLAGGELSGPEADAILDRVLESLDRAQGKKPPARLLRYWPAAAGAALAAAAAVVLVLRGGVTGVEPAGEQVRYEEGAFGPKLEIRCADGTLAACPVRSSLVFAVSGSPKRVFLSAYAERVGTEGGQVFYFAEEGGGVEIAAAAAAEGARAAEAKVRLSPEHEPGRYRVHAFVAERVLGREEMQAGRGEDAAEAEVRVEVVIVE
jgi:hypothetical protein